MASSENINLASLDSSWFFRAAFPSSTSTNPWLCDPTLSSPHDSDSAFTHLICPPPPICTTADGFSTCPKTNTVAQTNHSPEITTPASVSTGSDPETTTKRSPRTTSAGKKKITKRRKSRASKKSPTTFITADAANFRQMVQQITGVKFPPAAGSILQTQEADTDMRIHQLLGAAAGGAVGCLPTLDTSAFLLNHHQRQQVEDEAAVELSGTGGFDFDGYSSSSSCFPFPTLESCSWKLSK